MCNVSREEKKIKRRELHLETWGLPKSKAERRTRTWQVSSSSLKCTSEMQNVWVIRNISRGSHIEIQSEKGPKSGVRWEWEQEIS